MPRFRLSDDGYSETIEAESMSEAKEIAEGLWESGSWDHKAEVSVQVSELDGDGEAVDIDWVSVTVGEDPEPPECSCDDGHDFVADVDIVGGLKENPGVWSLGGTTFKFLTCCRHCGLYRVEMHYGSQRVPGQCDTVDYRDPDEASIAWVESLES